MAADAVIAQYPDRNCALHHRSCEVQLEGEGPWSLPDGGDDVEIVFTPGHTEGHVALLYRNGRNSDENTLFTGDHLAFNVERKLNLMK